MTQKQQILNHLRKGKSITSLQAINMWTITRLAAVIFDCKSDLNTNEYIESKPVTRNGKTFACYTLKKFQ